MQQNRTFVQCRFYVPFHFSGLCRFSFQDLPVQTPRIYGPYRFFDQYSSFDPTLLFCQARFCDPIPASSRECVLSKKSACDPLPAVCHRCLLFEKTVPNSPQKLALLQFKFHTATLNHSGPLADFFIKAVSSRLYILIHLLNYLILFVNYFF